MGGAALGAAGVINDRVGEAEDPNVDPAHAFGRLGEERAEELRLLDVISGLHRARAVDQQSEEEVRLDDGFTRDQDAGVAAQDPGGDQAGAVDALALNAKTLWLVDQSELLEIPPHLPRG